MALAVAALASTLMALAACGDDNQVSVGPGTIVEATPTVGVAEPTPEPPAPAEVVVGPGLAEALTVDWGCGYGFWVSNEEQTVALLLQFEDFEAAASGNVPPVGNVPSIIWSGEVRVGADLMANWCDDVVEPDEPTPRVDATWTVVDGAIAVTGDIPVQSTGPLTLELTDAVIESDSGEQVPLGPITVVNEVWGAFAG